MIPSLSDRVMSERDYARAASFGMNVIDYVAWRAKLRDVYRKTFPVAVRMRGRCTRVLRAWMVPGADETKPEEEAA